MPYILIIDDDQTYGEMLGLKIRRMGYEVKNADSLAEGLKAARQADYDVIFLDVLLPDGNGLEALTDFQSMPSIPEIIIITGLGDADGAEMAIKSGAWAYVEKGASIKDVILPLERALQYRKEKRAHKAPVLLKRESIVGTSPKIDTCLRMTAQAANGNSPVLISGETGTGKELFSLAIHENSPRAAHNFVVVDCASLPGTLVESVLFGHEKGAFTGADQAQDGLIAQAHKGTLFLDEVGELPLPVQKAFLRVLQEHSYRPVGGQKERYSDFRLVAATNRDLNTMAERGQFRKDLLYRLRGFVIELPPLRERLEDTRDIVFDYTARLCRNHGMAIKGFSPDFFDALTAYDWPGNVRELLNTMDRVLAAAQDDPTLYVKHLPQHIRIVVARNSLAEETGEQDTKHLSPMNAGAGFPALQLFRETTERKYFQDLLAVTAGDTKAALEISGLSRSRFYELLKKYKIAVRSDHNNSEIIGQNPEYRK